MGVREEAAPFYAKISAIEYVEDPITRSRQGVGKKPDLSYSRHTHTPFLCETPSRCKPKNTERDGCCSINCAVETDVPDGIPYGRILILGTENWPGLRIIAPRIWLRDML
jgi:hypothetical protein